MLFQVILYSLFLFPGFSAGTGNMHGKSSGPVEVAINASSPNQINATNPALVDLIDSPVCPILPPETYELVNLQSWPVQVVDLEKFTQIYQSMGNQEVLLVTFTPSLTAQPFGLGDLQKIYGVTGSITPLLVKVSAPIRFNRGVLMRTNQTLPVVLTKAACVRISRFPKIYAPLTSPRSDGLLNRWIGDRINEKAQIRLIRVGGVVVFDRQITDKEFEKEIVKMHKALSSMELPRIPVLKTPVAHVPLLNRSDESTNQTATPKKIPDRSLFSLVTEILRSVVFW